MFFFIVTAVMSVIMISSEISPHEKDTHLTHLSCVCVQVLELQLQLWVHSWLHHGCISHTSVWQLTCLWAQLSHLEGLSGSCHINPSIHLQPVHSSCTELVNTWQVLPSYSPLIAPSFTTQSAFWLFHKWDIDISPMMETHKKVST